MNYDKTTDCFTNTFLKNIFRVKRLKKVFPIKIYFSTLRINILSK